jgi:hypothetical protein
MVCSSQTSYLVLKASHPNLPTSLICCQIEPIQATKPCIAWLVLLKTKGRKGEAMKIKSYKVTEMKKSIESEQIQV